MRVHRLALEHVKGVSDRVVEFPPGGVVVVEGDNEAGKTTMVEALDLLFDEKDSSRKRRLLAIRPVGQDVPSAVEAEITSGPYRFTYRKQWFRRPGTVLTVTAPAREDLTGSAAHDRAQQILAETTDLDLWRALRLMQATPLDVTDLSGSAALADALDEAAGQVTDSAGAEGDSLLKAAEEAYREFHTATGRPTGALREAQIRREEAEVARDAAAAAVQEVTDDLARHTDAGRELARLRSQLAASDQVLEEARAAAEAAQDVVREADRLAASAALARSRADAAVERVEARAVLTAEVARREEEQERARAEHESLTEQREPGEQRLALALDALAEARSARDEARRTSARAESDQALVADLADLSTLTERLRRLDDLEHRRAGARRRLTACGGPVPLTDIEEASRAVEVARAEWRVGSAAWRLEPAGAGLEIEIDGQRLVLDAPHDAVLGETTTIDLPGVASLRLHPPAGAAARGEALAQAEARLAEALTGAGVEDLASARRASADRAEAARDLEEAQRAFDLVLGAETLDELARRVEDLCGHVGELVTRRIEETSQPVPDAVRAFPARDPGDVGADDAAAVHAWVTAGMTTGPSAAPNAGGDEAGGGDALDGPGDLDARRAAGDLRARAAAADEQVARAEAEVAALREQVETDRLAAARAEVAAESARAAGAEAVARLAAAREARSDEDLAAEVERARAVLAEAVEAEGRARAEVARHDPDSARVRLEGAVAASRSLRSRHGAVRDEVLTIEARLRHVGEQGRAERLTEAESTLARADRALASVRRRAGAARTLYETLVRHREDVTRSYVEPFGAAVNRLGRVVYGPGFDVEVGPSLTVDARILNDERIPYESLSSGAKEQLGILTRLACASLVDPEQGAPVILDDALGYSDPARLQRVCAAFSLVGAEAQIILLTCTPGRYDAIPDAHVIRLPRSA